MSTLSQAIEYLYPNARQPDDYIIQDDGAGPYLVAWHLPGKQRQNRRDHLLMYRKVYLIRQYSLCWLMYLSEQYLPNWQRTFSGERSYPRWFHLNCRNLDQQGLARSNR